MEYVSLKSSRVSGFIKEQTDEERKAMRKKLEQILLDTYKDFDTKGMKRVITRYSWVLYSCRKVNKVKKSVINYKYDRVADTNLS